MADNKRKCLCFGVTKVTPRDGGGHKIGKNLQIWLPSKKENANIYKIDFPVLCTFTLFNADFCTFLQSL